jgi:glutaredoxin
MHVVLYTRSGCGLCDRAREILEAQRIRTPFELEEIDIEGDDALELDYGVRIPVVTVDSVERFEVEVDPAELATLLEGA